MKSIIGTGLSGLVGTRIVELLADTYVFEDMSLATGIDITDQKAVESRIKSSQAEWVFHLAAKADVDGCEKDKSDGKQGAAWKVNVYGTQVVCDVAKMYGKRVLFISTDFVFDGSQEWYTEADTPHPINWYAQTKYEAEKIVLTSPQNIVVRIAYPYRASCLVRRDFVHAILHRLKDKLTVEAITDHIFTPTFIDDIANALDLLIAQNTSGIYHVVGSQTLSPYDAACEIAMRLELNKGLISKTTREQYYKNRAERPFQLRLKNDKIAALGIHLKTLTEGLQEIEKQGVT